MDARTPTLAAVIRRALDLKLASVRVALPARIKTFNATTQLASVQPLLRESHEGEDGKEEVESLPVISDVPIQFPGAGGFVITFPVAVGDPCWLVFSDRSLDKWIETGNEVDPIDLRRHHLSDAVALLGVRSKAGALAEFDASNARFGKVGGPGVTLRSGEVHLGVNHNELAADAVACANKVKTELDALITSFNAHVALYNTHVHPVSVAGVTPGTGAGTGSSTPTVAQSATKTPSALTGSAVVKVKP